MKPRKDGDFHGRTVSLPEGRYVSTTTTCNGNIFGGFKIYTDLGDIFIRVVPPQWVKRRDGFLFKKGGLFSFKVVCSK